MTDIMRSWDCHIRPTSTVAEVAIEVLRSGMREAPVVDAGGYLCGVVYADDLFSTNEPTIESIVKPPGVLVSADASPAEATRKILDSGRDQAYVVDGPKLVGLFMWRDVVRHMAD